MLTNLGNYSQSTKLFALGLRVETILDGEKKV